MTKELYNLESKRWEKVGRQELRSNIYKREINPEGARQKAFSATYTQSWAENAIR
jgi:hypothetical protein